MLMARDALPYSSPRLLNEPDADVDEQFDIDLLESILKLFQQCHVHAWLLGEKSADCVPLVIAGLLRLHASFDSDVSFLEALKQLELLEEIRDAALDESGFGAGQVHVLSAAYGGCRILSDCLKKRSMSFSQDEQIQ